MKNKSLKKRIVRVQSKGILTLPVIFRRQLGIEENDLVEVEMSQNELIVRKIGQDRSPSGNIELYSEQEIADMLKKDILHPKIAKKIKKLVT